MMLVGNEKYQFAFTSGISCVNNTTADSSGVVHFQGLKITYGTLQHTQEPYINYTNKGVWELPSTTPLLTTDHNGETLNADTPYYLYAVVADDGNAARYELWGNNEDSRADDEAYLLMGVLSSEFEDNGVAARVFSRTNGYTAIEGGTITTEQIQDAGRNLIIDFQSNPPRIIARNNAEIIGNIRFKAGDSQTAEEQLKALGLLANDAQSSADAAATAAAKAQAAIDDMEVGGENLCGSPTAKVIYSDDNIGDNYSEYYKCVDLGVQLVANKNYVATNGGCTEQVTKAETGATYVTPSAFTVTFKDTGTSYEYSKSLVATSNGSTSFDFTCGTTGSKTLQLLFPYNSTTYGAIYMFGAAFTAGYKYRVKVNYYKPTTSVGAYCVVTITQLSPTVTLTGDDARSLLIDELLNDTIDTGDIANLSDFKWGTTDDDGENTEYYKSLSDIQVQAGTRPTKFQAYTEHLTNALKGSTDVTGGLLMTNVLMLKNESNKVTAGMSGLSGTQDNPEKVLLWGGGDYYDASNAANSSTYAKKDGTPITTLLKKDGTGKIGIFKIDDESVMVENGGVRTVITSGSVQKFADANNIGYTDYNKTFTSAASTSHNCTIMERNFDGTQTGTIKIPVLNFGVSYYGSDELRGASARIKVTVQYNNKTEVIYDVYQSNTCTAGYKETKTTTFKDGTYSNTFAKLQSFKIELLDAITTYGSIVVNFSCYAGTAGNSKACVIANDGMMLSSGDGNRFIIKPTDDAMSIIADLPIVSTKEDAEKLVIGQLFTDSSGIVRRFSYDDTIDGGTSQIELVSLWYLLYGKQSSGSILKRQILDLSQFKQVTFNS